MMDRNRQRDIHIHQEGGRERERELEGGRKMDIYNEGTN